MQAHEEEEFIDQLRVQFSQYTQNTCMSHSFSFHYHDYFGQKYFLVPLVPLDVICHIDYAQFYIILSDE